MHLFRISCILQLPVRLQQNSYMKDWLDQTDQFLNNNRRNVLGGKGSISHTQAIKKANEEYDIFRVKQDREYISEFDKEMEQYLKG